MDPVTTTAGGSLLTNIFWLIGALLSLLATLGFLTFLRGFLLGLNQIVYIDGHEEHVDHARLHATHGLIIVLNAFMMWVAVKLVATLIGVDHANLALCFGLLILYGLLYSGWRVLVYTLSKLSIQTFKRYPIKKKSSGGH